MSSSSSGLSDDEDDDDNDDGEVKCEYEDDDNGERPKQVAPKRRKRRAPAARPKKRIIELEPPGLGPWWAFMMINVGVDEDSKKQTEVRLHTDPELIKALKNANDQGDWAIVMKMGPFTDLNFAGIILSRWSDGSRGQGPRITQGLCLWESYKERGIELHILDQSKKQVQEVFKQRRLLSYDGETPAIADGPGCLTVREVLAPLTTKGSSKSAQGRKKRAKATLSSTTTTTTQ